jgi:hypothetical protein
LLPRDLAHNYSLLLLLIVRFRLRGELDNKSRSCAKSRKAHHDRFDACACLGPTTWYPCQIVCAHVAQIMGSCSCQTFASGASSIETGTRPLLNRALLPISGHPLLKMTGLREELERLELSQYFEILVAEGFDTWETLLDIRESDL